jgi:hypothetical protein
MFDLQDISLATFALGRFVQYRLDEGMEECHLTLFKQAYFNLTADLDGRERLSHHALRSHIEAGEQALQAEAFREWPSWLLAHEKQRQILLEQRSSQNMTDPDG